MLVGHNMWMCIIFDSSSQAPLGRYSLPWFRAPPVGKVMHAYRSGGGRAPWG